MRQGYRPQSSLNASGGRPAERAKTLGLNGISATASFPRVEFVTLSGKKIGGIGGQARFFTVVVGPPRSISCMVIVLVRRSLVDE